MTKKNKIQSINIGTVIQRGLLFSITILLILILFQPFGTFESDMSFKYLRLTGYGLVTFCAVMLLGLLEIRLQNILSHLALKNFILGIAYWVVLTVFNYAYFVLAVDGNLGWNNLLDFFYYVAVISIFPLFIMWLISRHEQVLAKATVVTPVIHQSNKKPLKVTLIGENRQDKLIVKIDDLIAIKAANNYCELWLSSNKKMAHKLIRISLSQLLGQLPENAEVIRCHRSYAINLTKVNSFKGNIGGLRLMLTDIDEVIPVSRTYAKIIRRALSTTP